MRKHQEVGAVISNREVAAGIFQLVASAPHIAAAARPGQFAHLRVFGQPSVQFLRMPFAVFDADARAGTVAFDYAVVGAGTCQLSTLAPGDQVDVLGPVGNGWNVPDGTRHALLVAGGAGAPALNLLARELAASGARACAVLGAQSEAKLACADEIGSAVHASGGNLHITTDDGTRGVHGLVTQVSDGLIVSGEFDYVAICGPLPMMRSAAKPALEHGVACQVSMEKLMACGVGACLACVVETRSGRKRCCVDGPVFDAGELLWG